MNSTNTAINKQIEEFLSLQDFWILCRTHVKWFALSLTCSLLIAIYYLSTTPDIYTREAAVMVKMETTRGTVVQSAGGNDFNNMALVQQQTNVSNVLRQYKSLLLLTHVACRLDTIKDKDEAKRAAQALQGALTVSLDDEQRGRRKCSAPSSKSITSSGLRKRDLSRTIRRDSLMTV